MLRIMDDLKASGAKDAEPTGMFGVGSLQDARPETEADQVPRESSRLPTTSRN